jgi:hypothetical protein
VALENAPEAKVRTADQTERLHQIERRRRVRPEHLERAYIAQNLNVGFGESLMLIQRLSTGVYAIRMPFEGFQYRCDII